MRPNAESPSCFMTEDSTKEAMTKDYTEIYLEERKSLIDAQQQSYQQFDKAILALSSGGLGLSFIFLKDIVHAEEISQDWLLIISWTLFAFSILSTLVSFLTSQYAYKKQLELLDDYFIKREPKVLTERNKASRATELLNGFAALLFFVAIVGMICFGSVNLTKGRSSMSDEKTTSTTKVQQGQVPASVNKAITGGEERRGLVPPSLPQIPLPQGTQGPIGSSQPSSGQASDGSQGSSEGGSSRKQ